MKVLIKYFRSAPKNLTEAKNHPKQLFKPPRNTKHLLARSFTIVSTSSFIGKNGIWWFPEINWYVFEGRGGDSSIFGLNSASFFGILLKLKNKFLHLL